MPIFQIPGRQPSRPKLPPVVQPAAYNDSMRRSSEESIRTEDCEGPIPDTPMEDSVSNLDGRGEMNKEKAICTDRAELIERIKRGESPTWVPNQALQREYLKANGEPSQHSCPEPREPVQALSLHPAAEVKGIMKIDAVPPVESSVEIQRPRSALHSGDFTEDSERAGTQPDSQRADRTTYRSSSNDPFPTTPAIPWYKETPSSDSWHTLSQVPSEDQQVDARRRSLRDRAPSLNSYSSSYVLKAPTTPLVQQSNNTDLDFSPRERSMSPGKDNRHHTLPLHALHNWRSDPSSQGSASSQPIRHSASYRREGGLPYGHHHRRSLTPSYSLQPSSSPPTSAFLRSRRTSISSEASPLQHASLVGSYEESILRGWMSTAPSKPLDFTAQIGVLGKGNCKPKCPTHITVPFPAVFYNWSAGNARSPVNEDPSPYVGHIDLQHSLDPESKRTSRNDTAGQEPDSNCKSEVAGQETTASDIPAIEPVSKKVRKPRWNPRYWFPPGGSYRIPQQGQLQIVIKNPNKTAVKLFLVPYDLQGMESGTKTFVRQRCYSDDPVIDTDPVSTSTPKPTSPAGSKKKPTLRYLIHINICCPTRGRFYLHQHIRVVFANRVPDNKEPLRTEIQSPEPKFSPWKPNKESISSSNEAKLLEDKAIRRRSSGFGFDVESYRPQARSSGPTYRFNPFNAPPVPAIPFHLPPPIQLPGTQNSDVYDAMDVITSRPTTASDGSTPSIDGIPQVVQMSTSYKSSSSQGSDSYGKLSKGDSGYGGMFGRPGSPELSEGLLARTLKGLNLQADTGSAGEDM